MKNKHLDHLIQHICNDFEKNTPFLSCSFCNKDFKENEVYYVEKAFKHHLNFKSSDVILEYALCNKCMLEIRANLSIESKERIDNYFESNLKQEYLQSGTQCCIYGDSIYDEKEFQVVAVAKNGSLIEGGRLLILGAKAMDEIQELLSAQTKEELNNFFDSIIDMPPELRKMLKQGDYFVL